MVYEGAELPHLPEEISSPIQSSDHKEIYDHHKTQFMGKKIEKIFFQHRKKNVKMSQKDSDSQIFSKLIVADR